MFFRALTLFRFPSSIDLGDLEARLQECALKPCGPMEFASRGFVPPLGRDAAALTHRCGDALWLTVGGEDKLLPAAVVDKALEARLDTLRESTGRTPGGRARKRLKEDVVAELLPRALVKPSRLDALLDVGRGVLAVDTASRRAAENLVSEIRHALGSFPALPVNAEVSPRAVLTGWVAGDAMPEGLALGHDVTLQDAADNGSKVKCYSMEIAGEEVAEHLRAGRQATRLSLVLDDHVAFDLDESLVVRKLQLLDGAVAALDSTERDDLHAELDARFALLAGEVGRLFDVLQAAFRITSPEGE